MPRYRARIKETIWYEVSFDAESEEDAWNSAAEVFGTTDAEEVDYDTQIQDVELLEG